MSVEYSPVIISGKDQIKPINASAQKRNCHVRSIFIEASSGALTRFQVKLMIIDDSVGIVGNGNQGISGFHR